jgi:translocation and assembly module TamB
MAVGYMKKLLWISVPLLLGVLIISMVWKFSEKKISNLIRLQIQSLAREKAELKLEIEKVRIELIPPALKIENARFSPKQDFLLPFTLNKMDLKLDFLSLLGGKLDLSLVHLSGLSLNVLLDKIPKSDDDFGDIPLDQIFGFLNLLPVTHIVIDQSSVHIQSSKELKQFNVDKFSLLTQYNGNVLSFIAQATLKIQGGEKNSPSLKTTLRGFANKLDLTIDEFSAKSNDSEFYWAMETPNFKNFLTKTEGKFRFKLSGKMQEWQSLLEIFLPKILILQGTLHLVGDGSWPKTKGGLLDPRVRFTAEAENFFLGDYEVGSTEFEALFEKNLVTSEKLEFKHSSGHLNLKNLKLETKDNFELNAQLNLEHFDLQKLFLSLGLKNIPVDLNVKSELSCEGKLISDFLIKCIGNVHGSELLVKSDMTSKAFRILRLDEYSGSGWVSVDTEKVEFETSIQLHESIGNTQGRVDFKKGFLIQYQTDNLNLEHISELAGLNFKGKAKIQGKTEGDSSFGTIDLLADTEDFWFENFGLGNIIAPVKYKAGVLSIETEQGSFLNTQYAGQIDVDLKNSQLKGSFESPILYAEDIIQALSQKVRIPVPASGKGYAKVDFSGPFAIGGMSYNLEGNIQKGMIADETFDDVKVEIKSEGGHVTVANNTLRKNKSFIEVNGKANPQGMITLDFAGKNFRIEESSTISKIFPNLIGTLDFEMMLSNHILNPTVHLQAKAHQTIFGEAEMPDSNFILDYGQEGLLISSQVFGDQIRCNLNLPNDKKQASRLFLEINKMDFTEYLGLMTENPLRSEYKSNLNLRMDLTTQTDSFLDASGIVKVEDLKITRANQIITHNKPLWIRLANGSVNFDDFTLSGPETSLYLKGRNFSLRDLDLSLSGQLNVKLLQLFLPFFEEFGGGAKGDLRVSGNLLAPELYGNISTSEVFFKFKGFPHAFEKLSTQLEFSQKKILLNSIRGTLAGGSLAGDGVIEWRGYKDLFINIKTHLKDATLLVPDKVRTTGSGDIVFSGNWFPYILSGHYRIYQGLIEMDFSGDSENKNNLKQSIYLPKNILAAQFEPVRLDLQVVLDQNIEIKNPQMNAFIGGQLQIKGDPLNPILLGNIKTHHGSKLFFRDKPFDILSAFIKFNDPNELNPELFISARARIETYDVNLMIQGRAQKPQLLLSSQPPLEEQDIISLLALGITSQKLDKDVQSDQQAAQTGYQLGTAIISANPLNRQIKESLGVDVKFSSGFEDTKNTAPKVTVSREFIPNKLKISGTSPINDFQVFDVRLQYLLNENVSAVGTYEKSETQNTNLNTGSESTKSSIFGLDLEYKVEFR